MKIAIVSDSHGTLSALDAVIADVLAQAPDEVLLGGDLVQGGRQPSEVLDRLIELRWPAVLGNADQAVLETAAGQPLSTIENADDLLKRGLAWTAERLRPDHLAYLQGLPRAIRRPFDGGDFVLVHATPWSVEDVVLPDSPLELAERVLAEAGAAAVAYGHIHYPYGRRLAGGLLTSVGAVAGSNDRDPRPAYAIVTLDREPRVEFRRVAYDAAAEVAALKASTFPLRPARERQLVAGGDWPVLAP